MCFIILVIRINLLLFLGAMEYIICLIRAVRFKGQ